MRIFSPTKTNGETGKPSGLKEGGLRTSIVKRPESTNFGWSFRILRCPRITSWLRSFGTSSFHKKVEYAVCTQRLDFQPQKILDWALTFFHFFLPRWVDELGHEGRREVKNQQEPFVCFRWFFTFYHGKSPHITTRVMVSNIFYVHPYLGRWSNLTI